MATFGSLVCTDMGVRQEWGVQASAGLASASSQEARAAAAWCAARSPTSGSWRLCLPASALAPSAWSVGSTAEVLPMYAADATTARALVPPDPAGVRIETEPGYAEVIAGYAAWMDDPGLARLLVVPEDLADPRRGWVTAHEHGEVVGCAFVWWAGRTGYLSGIGVRADRRGRGIGHALTATAARLAAEAGPDLVWMHATAEGAALYARMGFAHVDDLLHVHATPV